ncbi:MAG: hypothetical protein GX587_14090 [Bacteroidales bacterium]|nr:hypothetical protein [Bacteroidales bacterium]
MSGDNPVKFPQILCNADNFFHPPVKTYPLHYFSTIRLGDTEPDKDSQPSVTCIVEYCYFMLSDNKNDISGINQVNG